MNIKIELDYDKFMDEWTWGDLEDLESGSPSKTRQLVQKYAVVDGVESDDLPDHLRKLSLREMQEVADVFLAAVKEASNPKDKTGKNSKRA